MEIRQAKLQDLSRAATLWQERVAVLQQLDSHGMPLSQSPATWHDQARTWLDDDRTAFFVAIVDGELAGFIVATVTKGAPGLQPDRIGKVVNIAVDLHRSHQGLSGALLDSARNWLREHHIDVMSIDVPAYYPVEQAFWRAQGGRQRFVEYWLAI